MASKVSDLNGLQIVLFRTHNRARVLQARRSQRSLWDEATPLTSLPATAKLALDAIAITLYGKVSRQPRSMSKICSDIPCSENPPKPGYQTGNQACKELYRLVLHYNTHRGILDYAVGRKFFIFFSSEHKNNTANQKSIKNPFLLSHKNLLISIAHHLKQFLSYFTHRTTSFSCKLAKVVSSSCVV